MFLSNYRKSMRNLVHRVRRAIQYGERQRPELRSKGLLIEAQVADAPRIVSTVAKALFSLFALFPLFASLANSPNAAHGQEPQARIKIDIDRAIGEAHPHLFGNFAGVGSGESGMGTRK